MSLENLKITPPLQGERSLTGKQAGATGLEVTTEDRQAARAKLAIQQPQETERSLRGLLARLNVRLHEENNRKIRAIATLRQSLTEAARHYALALTKTTIEKGEELVADMIARGLSFRTDGDLFSDAKFNRYAQAFASYPPDIAGAICRRLRPDGWLPATDTLEAEMREMVKYRQEVYEALLSGEVLTAEQIYAAKERRLGFSLIEAMHPFPYWDNGRENEREKWKSKKAILFAALEQFEAFANDGHSFTREVIAAKEYLSAPLVPYPWSPPTAEERQAKLKQNEAEHAEMKRKMLAEFEASVEDDMIAEIEGQKHV